MRGARPLPGRAGRRWVGGAIGSVALLLAPVAIAQEEPDGSAQGDSDAQPAGNEAAAAQQAATVLFRQGLAVQRAGNTRQALALFLASREAFAMGSNTLSAAACLEQLGRYDEALDLVLEAASLFDRKDAEAAARRLRSRVGILRLASPVMGRVVVDGKHRGTAPNPALAVAPGKRRIRVLATGYATFETEIEVPAGAERTVQVALAPLGRFGSLRVEDETPGRAQVLLDGAIVGEVPWEGTLGVGTHTVQTRSIEEGSAPAEVTITENQTSLVRLRSRPIGPRLRIDADPSSATLKVDGTAVGRGRWEGYLPQGTFDLTAEDDGYFPVTRTFEVEGGRHESREVLLRLRVDPDHPRWPRPEPGHFWVGAFGALGLGGELGSGPERFCPDRCRQAPSATGFLVAARGGYQFPFLLSLEVTAGAMSLWRNVERRVAGSFVQDGTRYPVSYDLEETIRIRGPVVGAGASLRVPIDDEFSLLTRQTFGAWFAETSDTVTGRSGDVPLVIEDAGKSVSSTLLVVMPELGLQWQSAPWSISGTLSMLFAPLQGPDLPHGEMGTTPELCTSADPGAPSCAPHTNAIAGERAYGPFWMLMPQVGVSRRF